MMTYFDRSQGRDRLKRRYVWAAWSFLAGVAAGILIACLL